MSDGPRFRIGELSKRAGISPELLRAWETRYGLLRPERTAGGLRLYSQEDELRLQLMRQHTATGLPASEAARLAKLGEQPRSGEHSTSHAEIEAALEAGLRTLDEPTAQTALDRLFSALTLQSALSQVILPVLHRLGERWAAAEASVAQEHFATNLIGARLRALTRGWGNGLGPRAMLACPPGEQHELGLLCFGLALREHGWRITYLGADTPVRDLSDAVGRVSPTVVVLSAVTQQRLLDASDEIIALVRSVRVGIGGAGASAALAHDLGVESLTGDAIGEAAGLAP